MTARKIFPLSRVLGVLSKAQLMCRGEFPVVVELTRKDGTKVELQVLTARFNENSGNVVLSVKE